MYYVTYTSSNILMSIY